MVDRVWASVAGGTTTGTGALGMLDDVMTKHSMQVFIAQSTGVTAQVGLRGSLDGTNWMTLSTWSTGTQSSGDIISVVDKPLLFLQANVTQFSGGSSSPTVTARIASASR